MGGGTRQEGQLFSLPLVIGDADDRSVPPDSQFPELRWGAAMIGCETRRQRTPINGHSWAECRINTEINHMTSLGCRC